MQDLRGIDDVLVEKYYYCMTILGLLLYQGTEIIHANSEYFHKKN